MVASTSMTYTDSEAVFTAIGDGTNATTAWYNHTATATNGLRLASGTKISARLDTGTGTPQAYLGLVDASAGTYFQLLDYCEISNEPDTELAKRWTVEQKLASIPVSVFYQQPPEQTYLRFCFAKNDGVLLQAEEILCKI